MKLNRISLAAFAAFAFATTAHAQNMKPGLWEISNKMTTADGQMEQQMAQAQQQMANLPPDQRKMMEQMMASRGIQMTPGAGGGGMSVRICMTPEMVQRNEVPTQQRGNCTSTRQPASGKTMKIAFTCTNPASSGEGEVTFASPEAYTMKMNVNSQAQGRPEKMTMQGSGKWLASDCGDIKPMRPAAK